MGRQDKAVKRQTRKLSRLLTQGAGAVEVVAAPAGLNGVGPDAGLLIFAFATPGKARVNEVCRTWCEWWEHRRNGANPAKTVHALLFPAVAPGPLPDVACFADCLPAVARFIADGGAAAALSPLIPRAVRHGRSLLQPAKGAQHSEETFRFIRTLVSEYGADRNATDRTGRNALHLALLFRDYQLASKLIRFGVDCRAADKLRRLPLHYCAKDGNQELLGLLLNRHSVDLMTKRDYQGHTPLDHCKTRHNTVYMFLLQKRQDLLSCRDDADDDCDYDDADRAVLSH